ncbi:MAG TPA: TlpA disulfide reductase family protein [Nitrospiria bacterium]
MTLKKIIYQATMGTGLLALTVTGCTPEKTTSVSTDEAPKIGYFAPNFRLPALTGEEISLASLKGKVVFLNFWATWCGPCKAEMPSMEALYQDFKNKDFEILAVSSDIDGERSVRPFVESLELSYPILLDPDYRVDNKYLVRSVPTSFLIDKQGVITHRIIGSLNWNTPESRALIKKLIEEG